MKKNGYTLAELLVSIGVIGILVTLMFKAINTSRPNEEQLMLKKSHHELSRVVHELINDDDLYPEVANAEFEGQYLANTTQGGHYKGRDYSGDSKFCDLFGTRLSLRSSNACTTNNANFNNGGHYTTTDGVVWILPITTFRNGNQAITGEIQIDVNGTEGDNCFEYEDETYGYDNNKKAGCKTPDRFRFLISSDGKIELHEGDNITIHYLTSPNNSTTYKFLREKSKIVTEKKNN